MDQVFGVEVHDEDGLLRVAVRGEVDIATAPQLRESLYEAVDRSAGPVIVDLLAVTFIDSTALGVLIGARERSKARGAELRVGLERGPTRQDLRDHRSDRAVPHLPLRSPRRSHDEPPVPDVVQRRVHAMSEAVELIIPVQSDLVVLARLTAATVASRAGFDVEEVEDLRLAVDELCVSIVNGSDGRPPESDLHEWRRQRRGGLRSRRARSTLTRRLGPSMASVTCPS